MGAWNMKTVMNCLKGADVAVHNWNRRKRKVESDAEEIRSLDAYDLALLLTIADRQHDEGADDKGRQWEDEDCFCYGNEGTLVKLARMRRSKFEECRAFLLAKGLITFKASDTFPDLKTGKEIKTYTNVYRLNKPALEKLKGDTLPCKQQPLATQASPACQASTNITIEDNKNSSMPDAADAKAEDKKRAELYKECIVRKYGLAEHLVGIEGILAGTKGKRPDSVLKAICEFGHEEMLDQKFSTWVRMLVNALKELPKAEEAIPPAEELAKQFSTPKKIPKANKRLEKIKACWQTLCEGLDLSELPKERLESLEQKLRAKVQGITDDDLNGGYLERIVSDVSYEKGKYKTFEKMREAMPDVNERADRLEAVIARA